MQENKTNRRLPKKSKESASPKLLQALQKFFTNDGGSVSYVFIEDRLEKKETYDKKTKKVDYVMEPVQRKSTLHCKLGPEVLKGEKPGTLKSAMELFDMFNTTKNDLGANYFILD